MSLKCRLQAPTLFGDVITPRTMGRKKAVPLTLRDIQSCYSTVSPCPNSLPFTHFGCAYAVLILIGDILQDFHGERSESLLGRERPPCGSTEGVAARRNQISLQYTECRRGNTPKAKTEAIQVASSSITVFFKCRI